MSPRIQTPDAGLEIARGREVLRSSVMTSPDHESRVLALLQTLVEGFREDHARLRQEVADERFLATARWERVVDAVLPHVPRVVDQILAILPLVILPHAPLVVDSAGAASDGHASSGPAVPGLAGVVKELVRTLNAEQLAKLSSTFSLEQRLMFVEMTKIVQEMDTAEMTPGNGVPGPGPLASS